MLIYTVGQYQLYFYKLSFIIHNILMHFIIFPNVNKSLRKREMDVHVKWKHNDFPVAKKEGHKRVIKYESFMSNCERLIHFRHISV